MCNYPNEEELQTIKTWNYEDFHGLLAYIHDIWTYADWGWQQEGNIYNISTGGWSGNEEIIEAMAANIMWWALYWQQSRRGGHYIFALTGDISDSEIKNKLQKYHIRTFYYKCPYCGNSVEYKHIGCMETEDRVMCPACNKVLLIVLLTTDLKWK